MAWLIEAWVDGGTAGSLEAYWAEGRPEGPSILIPKFNGRPAWSPNCKENWTFEPREAKKFPTKKAAEKEMLEIQDGPLSRQWSPKMGVVNFDV